MPPRDSRLCPALERALPADSGETSGYRIVRELREVLFGDGRWHPVTVRAAWRDGQRRWVVQLAWPAGGELWQESYLWQQEKMRPA